MVVASKYSMRYSWGKPLHQAILTEKTKFGCMGTGRAYWVQGCPAKPCQLQAEWICALHGKLLLWSFPSLAFGECQYPQPFGSFFKDTALPKQKQHTAKEQWLIRSVSAKSSSLFFCFKYRQNDQEHSYYLVHFHTFFWSLLRGQIITNHLLSQLSHHFRAKKDRKERMTKKDNQAILQITIQQGPQSPGLPPRAHLLTSTQPRVTSTTLPPHTFTLPKTTSASRPPYSHTAQGPPLADIFTFTLSTECMSFHYILCV